MLQAMNTGHDGSLTTVHANSPRDALSPLETMVAHGGRRPPDAGHPRADRLRARLIVQLARLRDGSRRVIDVTEVIGMEGDVITMQDIFVFEQQGIDADGRVHRLPPRHRHPAQVLGPARAGGHPPRVRGLRSGPATGGVTMALTIALLIFLAIVILVVGLWWVAQAAAIGQGQAQAAQPIGGPTQILRTDAERSDGAIADLLGSAGLMGRLGISSPSPDTRRHRATSS